MFCEKVGAASPFVLLSAGLRRKEICCVYWFIQRRHIRRAVLEREVRALEISISPSLSLVTPDSMLRADINRHPLEGFVVRDAATHRAGPCVVVTLHASQLRLRTYVEYFVPVNGKFLRLRSRVS